jgi:soluble lytic murein transglycosylase-like protein
MKGSPFKIRNHDWPWLCQGFFMRNPYLLLLGTVSLQLALVGGAPAHRMRTQAVTEGTSTESLSRLVSRISDSKYGLMDPFDPAPSAASPIPDPLDIPIEVPSVDLEPPVAYTDFQPALPPSGASPDDVRPLIWKEAGRRGVDPLLVEAVLRNESGFDTQALSPTGAGGLMQLMPDTARQVGVGDRFDPAQNIAGGTEYLAQQLDRFQGNIEMALAAYNAGPEAVSRYGGVPPYPDTVEYVRRVLQDYRALQGLPASPSPAAQ